jgi:hypothetical protein
MSSELKRVFSFDVRKERLPSWNSPVLGRLIVDESQNNLHALMGHVLFSFSISDFPSGLHDKIDAVYIESVAFDPISGLLGIGGHNQSGSPPLKLFDTRQNRFAWVTTGFSDDFAGRARHFSSSLRERYGPKILDRRIRSIEHIDLCASARILAVSGYLPRRDWKESQSDHFFKIMTFDGEDIAETNKINPSAFSFHPNGETIVATLGSDVILIRATDCYALRRKTLPTAELVNICFDEIGETALCASEEGELIALDKHLEIQWSFTVNAIPRCIRFEPISRWFYVGTNLGDLLILDENGNPKDHIRVPESIRDVAFAHDGRHIFVGCRNMDIHIFARLQSVASATSRLWEERLEKKQTSLLTSTASIIAGRVFISYSSQDKEFASMLEKKLESSGFKCWRDEHSLLSGRITKQIQRAMTENDVVLVVLSKSSLSSDWVRWEVSSARNLEKISAHDVICPITIDSAWQSWSDDPVLRQEIVKYHIVDFEDWKIPDQFDDRFQKLLAGLRDNYFSQDSSTSRSSVT